MINKIKISSVYCISSQLILCLISFYLILISSLSALFYCIIAYCVILQDLGLRSDLGLCPWDWSTRYCTNRRERPSLLDLLSEFGLISDGWLGSISPSEIGPMHLSVEGLRPGAQLGGRERGLEPPLAQNWRSYNYSRFDEFFGGVGVEGGGG